METRIFCVELKMGPSGHMDSTGIFPDSNTREFGPRRTKQRQPPRPTHKCNAPRLPFHVHLTHDFTRAASALPLHTAALAFVSFGIVLVQVQVQVLGIARKPISDDVDLGTMVQANHLKLLDLIGHVDILNMTMARIVVMGL